MKSILNFLAAKGLAIVDLREVDDDAAAFGKTCAAMENLAPEPNVLKWCRADHR
jgi:hypothetical protein